jgi:excisionase family DNA binding protein
MSAMKDDNVLTTDEAAKYLKISKSTLLIYIHQRKIKAKKVGRSWRVLQSEIYQFLKEEEGKS